jgi:hypothetical protein
MLGAAIAWYGLSRVTGEPSTWISIVTRAALVIGFPLAMLASPLFTTAERKQLAAYLRLSLLRLRPSAAHR